MADLKPCNYGKADCCCQTCEKPCNNGLNCWECEKAGKAVHDMRLCTGHTGKYPFEMRRDENENY